MDVDLGIPEVEETMVARHWDPLVVDAACGAGLSGAKRARRMRFASQLTLAQYVWYSEC